MILINTELNDNNHCVHAAPGLTISFSGQIPVFTGNEISVNFGEFRSKFVEFWIWKRNFPKNTEISNPGN